VTSDAVRTSSATTFVLFVAERGGTATYDLLGAYSLESGLARNLVTGDPSSAPATLRLSELESASS
jgi:hypothetical protein